MKYYTELVHAFRQLAEQELWNFVDDSFLIGVQSKQTSEIYWCSLMGKMKEVYGLGIYKGSAGLRAFHRILQDPKAAQDPELRTQQDLILFGLDPEEVLSAPQIDFVNKNKSADFGSGNFLIPTRMKPGFPEKVCTSVEIKEGLEVLNTIISFLSSANIADFDLQGPDAILLPLENSLLNQWTDYRVELSSYLSEERYNTNIEIPEEEFTIVRDLQLEGTIWEIHSCYAPFVIQDGPEGPYHPELILFLNKDRAQIVGHEIYEFGQLSDRELYRSIAKNLSAAGYIPCEIEVKSPKLHHILNSFLGPLGVDIDLVEYLPIVTDCLQSMASQFMQQQNSEGMKECCVKGTCG